jgi:hypothetical protein
VERLRYFERHVIGKHDPAEPTWMRSVPAATCAIKISGADLAMLGIPWCSANPYRV